MESHERHQPRKAKAMGPLCCRATARRRRRRGSWTSSGQLLPNNYGCTASAVAEVEWAGGLLDLADDPAVAALFVACTFCVFGWNMERLGLGNMYVHIFTFALLCAAPVLVFAVAALNIHDAAGALLSVLGLLYGGFWRAQMRRRLGLPGEAETGSCAAAAGRPATADYVKWLLCALAQEVRTANLYDVEEGKCAMTPLYREGCVVPFTAVNAVAVADAPPVPVMVH